MGHPIRKNLRHKAICTLLCVFLAFVYISCNHREIYYNFHEIKNAEWAQNDTLFFDIDSTLFELNTPYRMSIEVTNNVNYPYQNIWFFVQTDMENDSTFNDISKEYVLADKFGKWKGSGFGSLYQLSLPMDDIVFKEKRNYRIKIEHGMQDEPLMGIEKLG
ncbi:MAG: gliding motility lipoprotein GldH, partial [Prevotella sp.]|nr:gliding motility lipoprotein GldH [Prevotella sp.]